MAELGLSQTLGQVMGNQAQSMEQPDVAQKLTQGVQAGVQLATMQDQVEKSKVSVQSQKDELAQKQLNGITSTLQNLFRMPPAIQKIALPKIQENLTQYGADPGIAKAIVDDPEWGRNYVNMAKAFTGEARTPEEIAEALQAHDNAGTLPDAMKAFDQQNKQASQLAIANTKNEMLSKQLGMRQQNQGDRIQLSANKQYESVMKPAEQGLIAAHRADDIIEKVSTGELQANKTLRADLTGAMASLVSQGRPSTVYGQEHQEFDSAYQRVHDQLNFLQGDAKTTLAPKQLKQLKVDIDALRDLYGTQHETQYQSLREGLPDQSQAKLDNRYNTIRKKYGLTTLDQASTGQSQQASPAPMVAPAGNDLKTKAQSLVGKVVNPKTGQPYTQQEVDARLKGL